MSRISKLKIEIERGLRDVDWYVRLAFVSRADVIATPEQIERGLTDEHLDIREVFERRQAEWQAKWEAEALKKRHASVVNSKLRLEAL